VGESLEDTCQHEITLNEGTPEEETIDIDIGTVNHSPAWLTVRGFQDAIAKYCDVLAPVHSVIQDPISGGVIDTFRVQVDLSVLHTPQDPGESSSDSNENANSARGSRQATLGATTFNRNSVIGASKPSIVSRAVMRDAAPQARLPPTAEAAIRAHKTKTDFLMGRPLPKCQRAARALGRAVSKIAVLTAKDLNKNDPFASHPARNLIGNMMDSNPHRALGYHPLPCYVVEGEAGAGKTVLARWMVVTLMRCQTEFVPFYIPVKDFADFLRSPRGENECIVGFLVSQHGELDYRRAMVQQAIASRRAIFIFDGLQDAGTQRPNVEDVIWALALQFHRILVLARPGGYTKSRFVRWPWILLQIPDMSDSTLAVLAELRLGLHLVAKFTKWLKTGLPMVEYCAPLVLMMLAEFETSRGDKVTMMDLYERNINRMLLRLAKHLEIRKVALKIRAQRTLTILEMVAVMCHLKETHAFTDDMVRACHCMDKAQREGWRVVADLALENRAFIVAVFPDAAGVQTYRFLHRTIQDYLVSRALVRRLLEEPQERDNVQQLLPNIDPLFRLFSRGFWHTTLKFVGFHEGLSHVPRIASYLKASRCPPLVVAAEHGLREILEVMLHCRADFEARGPDGTTALLRAVMSCHVSTVDFLLQRMADVHATDKIGASALHVAAMCGHVEIISLLHRHSADLSCVDLAGWSASDVAEQQGYANVVEHIAHLRLSEERLSRRLRLGYGYTRAMEEESESGSPTKSRLGASGIFPSVDGSGIGVGQLDGADEGDEGEDGEEWLSEEEEQAPPPLQSMSARKSVWCGVRQIFDYQENRMKEVFNQMDLDNNGTLSISELFQGLKNMGIAISIPELKSMMKISDKNNDGKIDFDEFWEVWQRQKHNVPCDVPKLHSAIRWGKHLGDVQAMCTQVEAAQSQDPMNGNCALHIAAQNGQYDICEWLLSVRADVNTANRTGNTPLHMAISYGYKQLIHLLLHSKADPHIKNKDGCEAQHGIKGDKIGKRAWDAPITKLLEALAEDEGEMLDDALSAIERAPTKVEKEDVVVAVMRSKKTMKSWTKDLDARFKRIISTIDDADD